MESRLKEFDLMRTLAIFIILMHHLPGHSFNFYDFTFFGINYDMSWLNQLNRYFGLGIFIFISGYLINRKKKGIKNWSNIKVFVVKRYIRIIPLYIIAYIIFVTIFQHLIHNNNVLCIVIHLLGLQIIFASKYCYPVMTLWFVGLIISYYYVFVISARYSRNNKIHWSMIIAFPLVFIFFKYFFGYTDKRFVVYYGIFIFGIVSEEYKVMDNLKWHQIVSAVFVVILCMVIYSLIIYPGIFKGDAKPSIFSFIGLYAFIVTNLLMIGFVIASYGFSKYLCNICCSRKFRTIAYASYCMFLFHRPIWWAMLKINNPSNSIIKLLYLVLLGIPLIILLSYYLQRCYDELISSVSRT